MSFKDIIDKDLLSDVTDDQEKIIGTFFRDRVAPIMEDYISGRVDERVKDTLASQGFGRRTIRPMDRKFRNMMAAWRSGGYTPENPGVRITAHDMLRADSKRQKDFKSGALKKAEFVVHDQTFHHDNPMLLPRLIANVVREPMEVEAKLTPLLQQIRWETPGRSVEFPAVSSMTAGNLDMGETDRYPEGMLEFGSTVTATIGKVGIKVRFTEEMLKFSQFDIMGLHLRAAGTALIRWKEQKAADHIMGSGITQFDNSSSDPADWTSGRDADLLFNGTFALQDIHDMYAAAINDGFIPNALMMNPMAWTIFAQDPTMRNWAYAQGASQGIWQRVRGEVAQMQQWAADPLNNTTFGPNAVHDPEQIQSTYTDVPSLFPYPLQIIISPFINYNPVSNTTTIMLVDTRELGILAVNETVQQKEFEDPERDIMSVKLRERYAINVLNEGRAIRKAENVIIARSYDIDDKVHMQLTGPVPTGKSFSL